MRISGYSYPGFCLCVCCDPHKTDDERYPVFEIDEALYELTCDACGECLADTDTEWRDSAESEK